MEFSLCGSKMGQIWFKMGQNWSKYLSNYLTEAPITSLYNETLFGKSGVAMATWFSFPSFHKFSGTFVDWFVTFAVAMRAVFRLNLRKFWNILEAIVYVFTKCLFWFCWHFVGRENSNDVLCSVANLNLIMWKKGAKTQIWLDTDLGSLSGNLTVNISVIPQCGNLVIFLPLWF